MQQTSPAEMANNSHNGTAAEGFIATDTFFYKVDLWALTLDSITFGHPWPSHRRYPHPRFICLWLLALSVVFSKLLPSLRGKI